MKGPTVGRHKGKVDSRKKGAGISKERMAFLLDEYVTGPVEERKALVEQWQELREGSIPYSVLAEEYGVSVATIQHAVAKPEEWAAKGAGGDRRSTSRSVRSSPAVACRATRKRRRSR